MFGKQSLFFAVIVISLLSCASVPKRIPLDKFADTGAFAWQGALPEGAEGLDLFHGAFSEPALELWALRVDLANPGLRVIAGPLPEGGTVRALKVSSFAREYRCSAAINANPFDIAGKKGVFWGREGEAQTAVGLVVSGGVMTSPPDPRYDALVFYGPLPGFPSENLAGRAAVISQADVFSGAGEIETAVGGFYRILEDGRPSARALPEQARHPRSAAGVSADGRFLYLLVIDGRRPGSAGATEAETAFIMKRLGAADALCFDGGGSSALVLRRRSVEVLNTPAHIPGGERAVAACLGIIIRPIPTANEAPPSVLPCATGP
jgi:hypothetical protein